MVGKFINYSKGILFVGATLLASSCNAPTSVTSVQKSLVTTTVTKFAGGTKAVRINLSTDQANSSFPASAGITTFGPSVATVPTAYGGNGLTTYNPGLSAETFYNLDGETPISKPSWLLDFQVGTTALPGHTGCSTFGKAGAALDVEDVFRVSEHDCASTENGSGSVSDSVFVRLILDRNSALIGSAENLMIQVEYQASGIVPYSVNEDGYTDPEKMVDQLWKIFWSNKLDGSTTMTPFATFVPPDYSFCSNDVTAGPDRCGVAGYKGAPTRVKQIMIPLSSISDMNVIQFSRIESWNSIVLPTVGTNIKATFNTFCVADSPLCAGVVIRSISLIRI